MSIHGVLGESTSYPTTYKPDLLYAIPRVLGRESINASPEILMQGMDWWHAFEVSWLNPQGISQVAIARFNIPANSTNIVESKSLKLYLNGLNFTEFESWDVVKQVITQDISVCVGMAIMADLYELNQISTASGLLIHQPEGRCIDKALDNVEDSRLSKMVAITSHPNANLLSKAYSIEAESEVKTEAKLGSQSVRYQLHSNLLRSNCPVTSQPDWGTIEIDITTNKALNIANLLAYLLSYRQHSGFHEQCVEQVFADLTTYFKPSELMVRAWYTRRGGIDINPCRVSDISLLPLPTRLIRQ